MSAATPWKPHGYQERSIKFFLSHGSAGLFADPGLGKTSVSLAAAKILFAKNLSRGALVVTTLRACHEVWPKEIQKWREFNGLRCAVLHGPRKDEALRTESDVYVVNYEGLEWLATTLGWKRRVRKVKGIDVEGGWVPPPNYDHLPFDMLVVDESTKVKNSSTERFKLLKTMLNAFRRRYILTGTPAPNGLLDLFGQIYVLDQGNALGGYITHYRSTYFYPVGFGGFQWEPKETAEKQIYGKLKNLVVRLDERDYLKLPPLVRRTVTVALPSDVEKTYRQVENHFVALLESGKVVARNAASATSKMRQIASGGVYIDRIEGSQRAYEHLHAAKTDAIVELVDELSGKGALVAYETLHELERLRRAFPAAPFIGGGATTRQTNAAVEGWNAGKIPVLLVQPQSAAHALNLQEAGRAVIFATLPWDLELYQQLVKRLHRQGQKRRVFVYHVVARDTIDEVVAEVLVEKAATQARLLEALRRHYLGRRKAA